MRPPRKSIIFVAVVILSLPLLLAAAWLFVLPAAKHLKYAVLPMEEQHIGGRALVALSRLSLKRSDVCPNDEMGTESPVGFIVGAYRGVSDQDWFVEVLQSLLAAGCDLNAYNRFGLTPLMAAALYKQHWVHAQLLAHGAEQTLQARTAGRTRGLTAAQIMQQSQ